MLANKKVALIHVAKNQLHLSDTQYRKLLAAAGGVRSSKELDDAGFNEIMRAFTMLGFKSNLARATFGDRPGMATPPQVARIRALWEKYAGRYDEREISHWLEHFFGVSTLRFMDRDSAAKVLTALKAMVDRRHPHEHH